MSTSNDGRSAIERLGYRLSAWVERWMPSPFWALPLLAITGIKAREMFGYAIAMLLALVPFLAVVLYVLPY